jgi:hypothetical protein
VEFLPASRTNAEALLACFCQALRQEDAIGADCYGYHSGMSAWLHGAGFHAVQHCIDGPALPARFQPLDGKSGCIVSAVFAPDDVLVGDAEAPCPWYWTTSDKSR